MNDTQACADCLSRCSGDCACWCHSHGKDYKDKEYVPDKPYNPNEEDNDEPYESI